MTLDEYVLCLRELARDLKADDDIKEHAFHLYLGLALDLPYASDARNQLSADGRAAAFMDFGRNIPVEFARLLGDHLQRLRGCGKASPNQRLARLVAILYESIREYMALHNRTRDPAEPLCLHPYNTGNQCERSADGLFYRYLSFDALERYWLFGGRRKTPRQVPDRRELYRPDNLAAFAACQPNPIGPSTMNPVSLGRGGDAFPGAGFPPPVFLVPAYDAPHIKKDSDAGKEALDAGAIAAKLGLPTELCWDDPAARSNQGFMALRLRPVAGDRMFRPTMLDALDHLAFRPGPHDDDGLPCTRYGLTRHCKSGELNWRVPTVTDQPGCREVVMCDRKALFPHDDLYPEEHFFFEETP